MAKEPLIIFSWHAPEFRYYPKNPAWYITFVVVVVLLVIYQIFQQDYFGAVSLIVIAGLITAFARQTPKLITIDVSDQGIHINKDLIPYNRIRQFWIINDGTHKTLNLETTAYINHLLTIELEDINADELYEFLADVLPEHDNPSPTIAQHISHRFKF